ncbi:hypothetical protein [uncultured Sunxiuqinia sp.]|nr:hypothetical protein [uncultured Sunxiuqinia sp.]
MKKYKNLMQNAVLVMQNLKMELQNCDMGLQKAYLLLQNHSAKANTPSA